MQRGLVGSEMCIRDSKQSEVPRLHFKKSSKKRKISANSQKEKFQKYPCSCKKSENMQLKLKISLLLLAFKKNSICLLYTSDAADDTPCVDLGGRRIIKKKKI
eukprot:TRINITY_DN70056_c0_g1_i1.p1 TRINITY_DN70056_c0_g1~~TRINITY_DN70056_c0_g1_i1.p1  ORF type:complete len:103 (-),score=27.94 TRINITY_DN70056_c0_g1_i1:60-368(-)